MDFLSTAYDFSAVDFLEMLDLKFYKIVRFELIDIPLLKYVASKKKPMIVSIGMATLCEIEEAVKAINGSGNQDFILLKCSTCILLSQMI